MQLWSWLCLLLHWCLDNVTSSLIFAAIMSVFVLSSLVYPAYTWAMAFVLTTSLWSWNVLAWPSVFCCYIINVAFASSSAILAFFSSSFNLVDDLELSLDLLLPDDLELLDLLLLLHLQSFDDFCAASLNQLCTLWLKLNISWSRSSNQSASCCWFSASYNLQYSSWWLATNLNKSEYWSKSSLISTWLQLNKIDHQWL